VRPVLNLELTALPAMVPEARNALTCACLRLGIDASLREEIRLAVTEACSNCVLHAYDGEGTGTFTIHASLDHDALRVAVGDTGAGMPAGWPTDDHHSKAGLGSGLRLIRMLASEVTVESTHGQGTCVTMRFALPRTWLSRP
jgi:anti-sigma regulatory factor (Ser/Thr protein kinase)